MSTERIKMAKDLLEKTKKEKQAFIDSIDNFNKYGFVFERTAADKPEELYFPKAALTEEQINKKFADANLMIQALERYLEDSQVKLVLVDGDLNVQR